MFLQKIKIFLFCNTAKNGLCVKIILSPFGFIVNCLIYKRKKRDRFRGPAKYMCSIYGIIFGEKYVPEQIHRVVA